MDEEEDVKERESNEEKEEEEVKKRPKKNRKSRESRQLTENEYGHGLEEDEIGDISSMKRKVKSRQSRESRQITEDDVGYDEYEKLMNDQQAVKKKKARGSIQMETGVLSSAALETHNEHHLEEVAAQVNGPRDMIKKHKKSDTMTSDSSAYRAFMSVD